MRARSALFTLFGDVVRPAGGEAWLGTLTACLGTLGFTPAATRTALHRMSAEGWVQPRRQGRLAAYRLTPKGAERLDEAAERIYRLRAADWDKRWRLLLHHRALPAPVARELAWMGFGRLQPGVWVSPHPHERHLDELLDRANLLQGVRRLTADSGPDDEAIVRDAWDLSRLREAHEQFLRSWPAGAAPADGETAFAQRIRLVHHWRSFLFLDPGLPTALLPADWRGDEAARRFARCHDTLRPVSDAWFAAQEAER